MEQIKSKDDLLSGTSFVCEESAQSGFYISTPVGKYNPNQAIVFYKGSVKRAEDVIYSVADSYQAPLEKVMKSNSIFTII